MIDFVRFVRGLIADLVRPRIRLIAENALLRQQLIVAERKSRPTTAAARIYALSCRAPATG